MRRNIKEEVTISIANRAAIANGDFEVDKKKDKGYLIKIKEISNLKFKLNVNYSSFFLSSVEWKYELSFSF